MQSTKLNPTQLFLLQMFSFNENEDQLKELKEVWLNHVRRKVDEEGRRIWEEKKMNNEMIQDLKNIHYRTSYK